MSEAVQERSYWLGFSSFSGIGPGKFGLLLKHFGSAKAAWEASDTELEKVVGKALTPKFTEFREGFSIEDYERKLGKAKVFYLTLADEAYPVLLKQIQKPPFVLYYKGNKDLVIARRGILRRNSGQAPQSLEGIATLPRIARNDRTIAVVGTRKITAYGKTVTESLTAELVANRFVIISGLALGVDTTAHKMTLENKGKTIAVLGCGVDCCYPRENQRLYEEILDSGGAIVSEYPLGQQPSQGSFPSRNRIIAGLSQGVLVTEGAADSGALYTASEAFTLGRPVFAVPGPITSGLSKGPHSLIAKGGKLISGAEEIIKEFGLGKTKGSNPLSPRLQRAKGDTAEEQMIIDLLENENVHFDELVKRTKIDSSKLGGILSLMEMKGFIKSLDAGFFSLA